MRSRAHLLSSAFSSSILLILYSPHPLFSPSSILLILYSPHPLFSSYLLFSSSSILPIFYSPHVLFSSSSILLTRYSPHPLHFLISQTGYGRRRTTEPCTPKGSWFTAMTSLFEIICKTSGCKLVKSFPRMSGDFINAHKLKWATFCMTEK
jgi:hypothetical protein